MSGPMRWKFWLGGLAAGALAVSGCATGTAATRGEASGSSGTAQASGPDAAPAKVEISTRAQLRFEDAVKSFEAQQKAGVYDWVALQKKFESALAEDRDLAEADYNLGVIAERQGRLEEAAQHYRSALSKRPTLRQAGHNLAVLAQNAGDTQGAVTVYQQMLERSPDDALAWAGLADIYRSMGDHEQAHKYARAALVREPRTLLAFKVMMKSHLERKQLSLARLVAQRALKVDDKDPEVYLVIGQILLAEGEPDKARAQFKLAAEVKPGFLPAHLMLARMALEAQNWTAAEEQLRRILQVDGNNAEAHLNLGVAYRGMGQPDKAMQEYDAAEKLNPELAATYLNRAIILHQVKGAPERAIELYKKYVAMAGGDFVLTADAPVFSLLKEAEQMVAAQAEAKRMEEEAKKLEAAQAAQQQALQEAEGQGKAGGQVAPATGAGQGSTQPATGAAPSGADSGPAPADPGEPSDEPSDEPSELP